MLNINDNTARFLIFNGDLIDTSVEEGNSENSNIQLPLTGVNVYDVMRLSKGKVMFLEQHYAKLEMSAKTVGINKIIAFNAFMEYCTVLSEVNCEKYCNIKAIFSQDVGEIGVPDFVMYICREEYPDATQYKKGVRCGILEIERPNPHAKILKKEFSDIISSYKKDKNVFEVLLKNNEGFLTEGSFSNLFFVEYGQVVTAPSNYVLEGVTRKQVIDICTLHAIPIDFRGVTEKEAYEMDCAFLSGTTIKILPISEIKGKFYDFSSNEILQKIVKEFDNIMKYNK